MKVSMSHHKFLKYIYLLFFILPMWVFSSNVIPKIGINGPEIGKRCRIYLKEYDNVYYLIYLPYNYEDTRKFPIIFESPANPYNPTCGLPEDIYMGYGITQGYDYIWVCAPIVDTEDKIIGSYWGKDPLSTVQCWISIIRDVKSKYRIDDSNIVLCGFSRGAISCCYIGNYTEEISKIWSSYFCHAHFDGCCQSVLGSSSERINRIGNRKVLITVGENDYAKICSQRSYEKLLKSEINVNYIEIPGVDHSPNWILDETESTNKAREWLNSKK